MSEVRQDSMSTFGSSVRTASNTLSASTDSKQSKSYFSKMMKGMGSAAPSVASSVIGDNSPDVSDTGDSFSASASDRFVTPNKLNNRDRNTAGFITRISTNGFMESGSRSQSKGSNKPGVGPISGPGVRAMKGWSGGSEYSVSSRMSESCQSNGGQEHKNVQWQRQGYDQIDSASERHRCVLSELNRTESTIEMTGNSYSAELRKLQNVSKDRQNVNMKYQTKNTEYQTKNYLPRISEQFCSEQSFGQSDMVTPRNTSSVVACYNRSGERNSGAKNVLKEIIEKELRVIDNNAAGNEKKNSKRFILRLELVGIFLFDSLSLLLFRSPIFTFISLTSFFFFIFLEPLFFILSFLLFLFISFFSSSKS